MVNLPLANLAYEILTCLVLSLLHLNLPSLSFQSVLHSQQMAPPLLPPLGRLGREGPLSGAGLVPTRDGSNWVETEAAGVRRASKLGIKQTTEREIKLL